MPAPLWQVTSNQALLNSMLCGLFFAGMMAVLLGVWKHFHGA
jgi:hypothetical protein